MQYRGLDGKHRSSARGGAARSIKRTATGAALTLTTLFTLVTLSSAGCGDDDTINPGGGGSGGSGGRAGSGGGGGGGRAGTGGGGAGGTGGIAGTGGAGGTGGTAGTGGAAGTGGSSGDDGDAGVTDGGDAAPPGPLTRQESAEAICAHFDAVPACTNSETCVDDQLGGMDFFTGFVPECPELVDAYVACQANSPQDAYECVEGSPATTADTCQTEFNTMMDEFGSKECCPEQNCM